MDYQSKLTEGSLKRELDIFQLVIAILMKWTIVAVGSVLGIVVAASLYMAGIHDDSDTAASASNYKEEKEYYDRMKEICEASIEESFRVLEKGMPDEIPEGSSELDQVSRMLSVCYNITVLKGIMDELEEPADPAVTRTGGAKKDSPAKIIVGGAVGGAVVAALIVGGFFIVSGCMLSADEFKKRYGIRMLSVVSGEGKYLFLRNGRDKNYLRLSTEEQIRIAKANLSAFAPGATGLLLVGTLSQNELEHLAAWMNDGSISFKVIASVNENSNAYYDMKETDKVIIVEKVLSSRYDEIDLEVQTLLDWGKTIVGAVILT